MENNKRIPWNKGIKTNSPAHNSLQLDKDILYDMYINKLMTSEEIADEFNCSSRTIRNYLHKYNIPVRSIGDSIKLERSKWSDEKELERSRKFHTTWINKSQKERDEIHRKRMSSQNVNSPEAILKAHQTRLQNNTSNTSKAEKEFLHKLILMGFNENEIISPYIGDSRYPYNCDYYIPSKDLFIEYQGHQTHGPDIFDKDNEEHIKYLIKYQDNGVDMSTWFKRDPQKLKTAIDNKINLILVYQKGKKVYYIHNGKITTIDINDINKI